MDQKVTKKIERFLCVSDKTVKGRTTMKLRKFRKASMKKIHSEDHTDCGKKLTKIVKPVKKRTVTSCGQNQTNCEDQKMSDSDEVRLSESSTMTLEQFTDIVLASEGMTTDSSDNATDVTPVDGKNTPSSASMFREEENCCNLRLEGNNNNSIADLRHNSMVANILQNKDLTVEVKPVRVKPVVLSPRQPDGNLLYHRRQSDCQAKSSNSVMISVEPRQETHSAPLPPPGRPQSVPKMVEEWFKKMQPPLGSPPLPPPSTPSPVSLDVLNLSVKNRSELIQGKPTQIYLKPISTIQDPSKLPDRISPPHFTSTPRHINPPLSPPRLEIKRVEHHSQNHLIPSLKLVGRAFPMENETYRESVKARALRDIQLAHTKDMHGNLPIHMSVLMRKLDLVKRYCCVLQVLDSSIDLFNEEHLTPLHLAIRDNSIEIVELLLAFGADPVFKDGSGNTGLHIAAATRSTECLKILAENVRNNEDLNEVNEYGITPLHITIMNGNKVGSDLLIRNGANPKAMELKRDGFEKGDGITILPNWN